MGSGVGDCAWKCTGSLCEFSPDLVALAKKCMGPCRRFNLVTEYCNSGSLLLFEFLNSQMLYLLLLQKKSSLPWNSKFEQIYKAIVNF